MTKNKYKFFLDSNCVDEMELHTGDKIICTSSTITERIGMRFTVTNRQIGKKTMNKSGLAPLWWLKHCASYGDKFEKMKNELD